MYRWTKAQFDVFGGANLLDFSESDRFIRISRVLRASCDHVYPLRRGEHFKPGHPCLPVPPGHRDPAKRQLLNAGLTPYHSHYRKSAVAASLAGSEELNDEKRVTLNSQFYPRTNT